MKRATKQDDEKQKIVNSFMKIVSGKNVSKISVTEVMSDSGMQRQKFYYYFEDINHLIKYVIDVNLKESFDNFFDYDKNVYNSFITTLNHMKDHRKFYRNFVSDGGFGVFERALCDWMISCAHRHIGIRRMTEEEKFSVVFYEKGVTIMISDWIRNNMDLPVEVLSGYLTGLMPGSMAKYYDLR